MNQDHRPARVCTDKVIDIVRRHVIVGGKITSAIQELMQLEYVKTFLGQKDEKQTGDFAQHAKRYLSMYLPNAGYEIAQTDRYAKSDKVEACIIATKDWRTGDEIRHCTGTIVSLSEDEEKALENGRDFSIMWSSRKASMCLFLGPARFVNHDCNSNCKFIAFGQNTICFKVLRDINVGDEITTYYGANYFGEGNCECLCATCEKKGEGAFRMPTDGTAISEQVDDIRRSTRKKFWTHSGNGYGRKGYRFKKNNRTSTSRKTTISGSDSHFTPSQAHSPSHESSSEHSTLENISAKLSEFASDDVDGPGMEFNAPVHAIQNDFGVQSISAQCVIPAENDVGDGNRESLDDSISPISLNNLSELTQDAKRTSISYLCSAFSDTFSIFSDSSDPLTDIDSDSSDTSSSTASTLSQGSPSPTVIDIAESPRFFRDTRQSTSRGARKCRTCSQLITSAILRGNVCARCDRHLKIFGVEWPRRKVPFRRSEAKKDAHMSRTKHNRSACKVRQGRKPKSGDKSQVFRRNMQEASDSPALNETGDVNEIARGSGSLGEDMYLHSIDVVARSTTWTRKINEGDWTPFQGANFAISEANYTSNRDERGYVPVYEYSIGTECVRWDRQTGHVHVTALWRAVGYPLRQLRDLTLPGTRWSRACKVFTGGRIEIGGQWMPYGIALEFALQYCGEICFKLIPLFGAEFPSQFSKSETGDSSKTLDDSENEGPIMGCYGLNSRRDLDLNTDEFNDHFDEPSNSKQRLRISSSVEAPHGNDSPVQDNTHASDNMARSLHSETARKRPRSRGPEDEFYPSSPPTADCINGLRADEASGDSQAFAKWTLDRSSHTGRIPQALPYEDDDDLDVVSVSSEYTNTPNFPNRHREDDSQDVDNFGDSEFDDKDYDSDDASDYELDETIKERFTKSNVNLSPKTGLIGKGTLPFAYNNRKSPSQITGCSGETHDLLDEPVCPSKAHSGTPFDFEDYDGARDDVIMVVCESTISQEAETREVNTGERHSLTLKLQDAFTQHQDKRSLHYDQHVPWVHKAPSLLKDETYDRNARESPDVNLSYLEYPLANVTKADFNWVKKRPMGSYQPETLAPKQPSGTREFRDGIAKELQSQVGSDLEDVILSSSSLSTLSDLSSCESGEEEPQERRSLWSECDFVPRRNGESIGSRKKKRENAKIPGRLPQNFDALQIVFVDPDEDTSLYWWPALLIPRSELDDSIPTPPESEHVVRYFDKPSYDVVLAHELREFSPYTEPFRTWWRGCQAFTEDSSVREALAFWDIARSIETFEWRRWRQDNLRDIELKRPPRIEDMGHDLLVLSYSYKAGADVLVSWRKHPESWYEARIQKVDILYERDRKGLHYFVHYPNWNKKYDEWVIPPSVKPLENLLAVEDEACRVDNSQKRLASEAEDDRLAAGASSAVSKKRRKKEQS